MAFRSDDQDYRWSHRSDPQQQQHELARGDAGESLSLRDTLRELALTVAGFVGIIACIIAVVSALQA